MKKPTKFLNYTIVCWFFAILAVIFEAVALGLYLAQWNGLIWILYTISSLGFVFVGVAIAMIFCMNFDKDPSVENEINYEDKNKEDK